MSDHQLDHAWRSTDGHHHVRCTCGKSWDRERLADAAVALERHQFDPQTIDHPAPEGRAKPRRAA